MNTVGQIERATQNRVVKLFHDSLSYDYLGDWSDRPINSNIEVELLSRFLKKQGYDDALITKALHQFSKVAGDQTKSLYDSNNEVTVCVVSNKEKNLL